jgi:hypothetical protein
MVNQFGSFAPHVLSDVKRKIHEMESASKAGTISSSAAPYLE